MMIPHTLIVPLFAVREDNYIEDFLGTAAFVGQPPLLVTAEHVVRAWGGPYAIMTWTLREHRVRRAQLLVKREDVDLALLKVPDYPLEKGLELAQDDEIAMNQWVACFEYSRTDFSKGSRELALKPITRLGNVTRLCDLTELYGKAGEDALELSFPTLKGASGAPIVSNETHRLWGIVKANVEYHRLPVQTITVRDPGAQILEETYYMLPQGIAVHVKHMRSMLEEMDHPHVI